MPSFEDVTPTVPSEFSASGEPSKYEKQSVWNYFLLVVLGSALVFSKVGSWGLCSPLSVNVTQTHSCGMRRMPNEEDPPPPLWLRRCAVRESHKHIRARPSHTFTLPRVHTRPSGCAKGTACTQTNVNSCTLTKHGRQQNSKLKKRFLHKHVHMPSKENTDMQHLFNNNSLIYFKTILSGPDLLKVCVCKNVQTYITCKQMCKLGTNNIGFLANIPIFYNLFGQ